MFAEKSFLSIVCNLEITSASIFSLRKNCLRVNKEICVKVEKVLHTAHINRIIYYAIGSNQQQDP